MKITKIHIENINSLHGAWTIDLSHPDYSDGLFAIIGETGSGKTTIFDAICLALYGTTPRIADGIGLSLYDLASKTAGKNAEVCAAVTCEHQGHIYESSFRFRVDRSGRKISQQSQEGMLRRDGVDFLHWTSAVKMRRQMEEVLGRTFNQFTRTVMLAQGDFSKFLEAGEAEQTAILQKITGTGIYSRLCRKIKERRDHFAEQRRQQCEKYGMLAEGMITREAADALEKDEQELQAALGVKRKNKDEFTARIKCFDEAEKLLEQLKNGEVREARLKREVAAFEPERERLKKAAVVREVRECFELNETRRNLLTEKEKEQMRTAGEIRNTAAGKEKSAQNVNSAKVALDAVKKQKQEQLPKIEEAEKLDHDIELAVKSCSESQAEQNKCQAEWNELQRHQEKNRRQRTALENSNENGVAYLRDHAADGKLEQQIPAWEQAFKHLALLREGWRKARKRLEDAEKAAADATRKVTEARKSLQDARDAQEKEQKALDKITERKKTLSVEFADGVLERLVEEKRRAAAAARLAHSDNLVKMRSRLLDGTACPLCGALAHPYAEGNIPQLSAEEAEEQKYSRLLKELQEARNDYSLCELRLKNAVEEVQQCLQREEEAVAGEKNQASQVENTRLETVSALAAVQDTFRKLQQEIAAVGVELPENAEKLPPALQERAAAFAAAQKAHDEYSGKKTALVNAAEQIQARLDAVKPYLEKAQKDLQEQQQNLKARKSERWKLLGDADAAAIRKQLEADEEKALGRLRQCEREAAAMEATSRQLEEQAGKCREELAKLQTAANASAADLAARFAACNMTREQYLAWLLPDDEYDGLLHRKLKLDAALEEAEKNVMNCRRAYDEAAARVPSDVTVGMLKDGLAELEKQLSEGDRDIGRIQENLRAYRERQQKLSGMQESVQEVNRVADYWELFYNTFAKGEQLADFAQKVTLDCLLKAANVYLRKLSGRYSLYRKSASAENNEGTRGDREHSIWVADSYRGGEARRSGNLSGGEKFLVSLALALGLGKLNDGIGSGDSFFLDEGFGNLSGEALEASIKTLKELRGDGKMVGVISHVSEIAGNIGCQLKVSQAGNGCSRISGPGVSYRENAPKHPRKSAKKQKTDGREKNDA